MNNVFDQYEVWFVTGAQLLYGGDAVIAVDAHSNEMVNGLNESGKLPVKVVYKGTANSSKEVEAVFKAANNDDKCVGVITWMHTFSPAKMWIHGLQQLKKPLLHLHTQFNKEIPWDTMDIPSATGYVSQMQNIGQVTNKGVELTISGDILSGRDYVLSANLSLGMNKMKVDKLNGTDNVIWDQNNRWKSSYNDYCLKVGDQVGLIYGFVYDGLYSMDEFYFDPTNNLQAVPWGSTAAENGTSKDAPIMDADGVEHPKTIINQISGDSNSGIATLPGKVKFKDLNGDGYITEDDRTVIGNTNPKVQGGFGLSGQWKGFDFAMNFNFMLDFDVNNATAYQLSSSESNKNKFYNVLSTFADKGWRYTRDGDGECLYKCYYIDGSLDMYRELNEGRTLWNPTDVTKKITHSYFIEDGSFLRCQDLTVGYTLPGNLTSKWGISKARFYVSASNLFIITGYSGYDPEVDIQTGLTCGMDYNRYPRSRSFVLGTNITF